MSPADAVAECRDDSDRPAGPARRFAKPSRGSELRALGSGHSRRAQWAVSVTRALAAVDVKDFAGYEAGRFEVEDRADDVGDLAQMAELTLLKAQPDLHQLDGGDPPRGACEQSRPIACP